MSRNVSTLAVKQNGSLIMEVYMCIKVKMVVSMTMLG